MPAKSTKKKTTKKETPTSKLSKEKRKARTKRQLYAVVLFAVGIFLLSLCFIKGTNVWFAMHKALFGLFGLSTYLIPILTIYLAVSLAWNDEIENCTAKVAEAVSLIVLLSAALQIFIGGMPVSEGFFNRITEVYKQGVSLSGGGVASYIIGIPLYSMFGKVPAAITICLLIFLLVMILTGATLFDFFAAATKPYKKTVEAYKEKVEQKEDEYPSHPVVTSPRSMVSEEELRKDANKRRAAKNRLLSALDGSKEPEPFFGPEALSPEAIDEAEKKSRAIAEQKQEDSKTSPNISVSESVSVPTVAQEETEKQEELPTTAEPVATEEIQKPQSIFSFDDDLDKLIDNEIKEGTKEQEESSSANKIFNFDDEELEMNSGETDEENLANKEQKEDNTFESADPLKSLPEILEAEPHEKQYNYPSIGLLKEHKAIYDPHADEELRQNGEKLIETLKSFGVGAKIVNIAKGPAVTRYELTPSAGVKISKITNLADDIALNLAAAGVRIEAPIPNKPAVGIEVPNKNVDVVTIREILSSKEFEESESKLSVALGKDIAGKATVADIAKMPHVLIAGATGSGKSVCINSIIISLIYKSSPDEVKLLMVDPKVVELGIYNGIPHLLVPVVTDPKKAAGALSWAVTEMLNRYKIFADEGVRDLKGYNRLCKSREDLKPMPQIVIIIDELADLMMASPTEVEDSICRLAQMARAAGMHLVIATQRPSVDVITGVIKANIPSRIAFAVSSQVDSRTILDGGGAEKLLGRGDMLFYPVGSAKPKRVQGCFVSDEEVEKIVKFIKDNDEETIYDETIIEEIEKQTIANNNKAKKAGNIEIDDSDHDEMFYDAVECVVEAGQASVSLLQRKLKLGFPRAARIMDELEEEGYIGEPNGSKPREVLLTRDMWLEKKLAQSGCPEEI